MNYKKPVPTPNIILGRAKFVRRERNKIYTVGTVEDGDGTIYAMTEAMFIEVERKPSRL